MSPESTPSPGIHCEVAAKLNFACHQSAYSTLRDLRITNSDTERRLENCVVHLTSSPAFIKPKKWSLDRVAPLGVVPVKDRDIDLDGEFFLNLSDSMRGAISVVVEKDGQTIGEKTFPVELLAYNEWGGGSFMPELLAAFSMPNDPAIDKILHDASMLLRHAGKNDGIDGYKSKSRKRVWEITSAIYTAVANLGLTYAVPPAGFEKNGQKIRLPSQILKNRIVTCLDAAMLFASALEQAGLNPVIALPKEHAVVGVWLQPEELSSVVIDDAETLRKRIQLKELILFETTLVTTAVSPPFSKAADAAKETITPDKDGSFVAAVDIKRARAHRILPLGVRSKDSEKSPDDESSGGQITLTLEESPVLPDFDTETEDDEFVKTPAGRLERWQRKLLDLSNRNPLLNHKSTKTSLRLICPAPGLLEDKLAAGERISIASVPQPTGETQDGELHFQRTGESISEEYARDALEKRQVLVDLPKEELSRRSVEIFRRAQTALQEGGSNTLFLALGFLLWKRNERDEQKFRSPLILMPVTLERKSVRSGIKMLAHDDETRFNTTLLEMLRKDFSIDIKGLDGDLPADDSGVDVDGIWNTVRKAVKEAPGFEVIEEVVLGHFSFAKYLMWKDLIDRTEGLRESPVVEHLLDTPRDPYLTDIAFVDDRSIDKDFKPSDLLAPLPADASQMAAIATADRGKDFIIIGPPGTGKSQTISNMIAHLLGKGKTVLFVSEKIAALNVVHRRLSEVGLGRHCLELHSNKARKLDVIQKLGHAWEANSTFDGQKWEKEADRLLKLRNQLNQVVDRLHFRHRNGMTAHYAIGVKIRDANLAARVRFSWPDINQHGEDRLETMREAVKNLQIQACALGNVDGSPFKLVAYGNWSPQWEGEIVEKADALSAAAASVEKASNDLMKAAGIFVPDCSMDRLDAISELAQLLLDSYREQVAYALTSAGEDLIEALEDAAVRLTVYAEMQKKLSCAYSATAWRDIDGYAVKRHWAEADAAWWPKSFFARRSVINFMRSCGAQGRPDPVHDADIFSQLRKEGEAIDLLHASLFNFKGWQKHETAPDMLEKIATLGRRARSSVGKLADDPQSLIDLREKIYKLLYDGNDFLAADAPVGRTSQAFISKMSAFKAACASFEQTAGRSVRDFFADQNRALGVVRETAEAISARHAELNNWCGWRRRRTEALDLELTPLVDAIERGHVPVDEISETFEAAYCTWWSGEIIGADEVLRTFSTPEQVAAIKEFQESDSHFMNLTAQYINAKLAGNLPSAEEIDRKSSWGVLRRELQKQRQHKAVRQLIEEIPDVLTTLAPCLMMSPLSVAQYLPADQELFDVVIFDEASQITVWDAVGSIARGSQVIVAGDPMQMPPTNFFQRAEDDLDGDVDSEGDLESILDEMRGASIPEQTLKLHYRSRKESLIAFSNSRYYDNKLITFPAPVHPDEAVRLVRPAGFYARGKARNNQGEARAVVEGILQRLTSDDPGIREQSIGVVTFNTEQQRLIEDLLDEARSSNPSIEWAFQSDKQEPVFVKNLETVQGDERDVILFSVTYGPDESGHVTMNFGPLNREGGHRRLNVAVTRARSEMVVYSTLSPDQINLSRTQARGVTDLKHFLEYAERGPSALGAAVHGSLGDFESPFESAVGRELREKGWTVHPQVGVSAYRIDLGIVHPDMSGAYLAGVECDGATYHSSAYARERDKIRQFQLERLGWTLLRIWSTDWWTNKKGALEATDLQLRQLLEKDRESRHGQGGEENQSEPDSSEASTEASFEGGA